MPFFGRLTRETDESGETPEISQLSSKETRSVPAPSLSCTGTSTVYTAPAPEEEKGRIDVDNSNYPAGDPLRSLRLSLDHRPTSPGKLEDQPESSGENLV